MKIVLLIFAVVGFLKVISLFILCIVELYNKIKNTKFLEIHKHYGIFKDYKFYIIPTITLDKGDKYIELTINLFNIQYYAYYKLYYEDD